MNTFANFRRQFLQNFVNLIEQFYRQSSGHFGHHPDLIFARRENDNPAEVEQLSANPFVTVTIACKDTCCVE